MEEKFLGATSGTRTHDLFVTNEMLYQLSYCGFCAAKVMKIFSMQKFSYTLFRVGSLFSPLRPALHVCCVVSGRFAYMEFIDV